MSLIESAMAELQKACLRIFGKQKRQAANTSKKQLHMFGNKFKMSNSFHNYLK